MRSLDKVLTCIVVLWFWPATVWSQSDALMDAFNRYKELNTEGRYEQAIPFAEKALMLGEQELGPKHRTTAALLTTLGWLYKEQSRYGEAEALFRRSLAIYEKTLGPEYPDIASGLNNLALLYLIQGRYGEVEPLYRRALAIHEKALGPEHPDVATALNNLAGLYDNQGRYADAESLYRRSLAIREKNFGPEHLDVATALNNLAGLYYNQGRYVDAEPLYTRALVIREEALGLDHPDVATALNNLALLYSDQGRYADAESLYRRSLAIREKSLGLHHPDLAMTLNNLAVLYNAQGRYGEAEQLHKRSLAIREKNFGPDHPDVASSLNNLAFLYFHQGRYAEAEPRYRRSLAIWEKALGLHHPDVANPLNNLAGLYWKQGRYAEAEPLYKRSLAIWEEALGPDHPDVATALNNLALLYWQQGRYAEAEPLYRRSLAIREKALGLHHPGVAMTLNNLANLYSDQGRYGEAEPFNKRSLAIREEALGPEHPDVAMSLNNLALLYWQQGRYAEAEPLYRRALVIREEALGPDHPDVYNSLNNLAVLYNDQGRYGEAESLYRRSLAIREKNFGPDHPDVALGLNNLAFLYFHQGRYAEAEPLYRRSLAIWEKALGPDHPNVATTFNNLAGLYSAQDSYADALNFVRRASSIHRERSVRSAGQLSVGNLSEQKSVRHVFMNHIDIGNKVAENSPSMQLDLTTETFEIGQLAVVTSTAAAVAGMSARFSAGDDALARVVRERQDATTLWQSIDKKIIVTVSLPPAKRDVKAEVELRADLDDLDRRIETLNERLTREFPEYAELTSPKPASLSAVQDLLGPEEALLSYVVGKQDTFLWVVRKDAAEFKRLNIGREDLAKAVTELRADLDPTLMSITRISNIPSFDTSLSFELFEKIFAPAESLLEGSRHVFVVPDGAIQSLPFGVLVSEQPQASATDITDFTDYRQVPWLARKYAFTTLPSVSSLRALRRFSTVAQAKKPFGGFGDPVLNGQHGDRRGIKLASLFNSRGIADVTAVRKLAPLPETADELRTMALTLGSTNDNLFLGERATEKNAKTQDLSDYRVLAFATHGLVAGDLKGLAEPALVLTPPAAGTEDDDGLLTASEVATLKLNSDLVVLSACNTASADGTPGADALSGLAKAFFYAGSRALLVSHWPVASDASVQLTTKMLKETANDNKIGRAEALKRSMLSLMNSPDKPHYAHPMFWAPFVVVGEGGA